MKGIWLVVAVTFAAGMLAGKLVFRDAVASGMPCQTPASVIDIPDEYLAPMSGSELKVPTKLAFQCDERQHCSEMTSKSEAQFFLENCPDTKMDGDADGDACERQF